jgi:hypothetical protein
LIGAEGTKTPAGVRGWGDPTGAFRAEEAPLYPGGKRSAWSANQQTCLTAYTQYYYSILTRYINKVIKKNMKGRRVLSTA